MAELFYFSNKQDSFKHWFHANLNEATLILLSPLPDLCSVFEDVKDILTEKPPKKSKINELSNNILSPHNYLAPSIYLSLIKEIYWVMPEWSKKEEIHKFYWEKTNDKVFNFAQAYIPGHEYKSYEKENINMLFNSLNKIYCSTSFSGNNLVVETKQEKKHPNDVPIHKIYLEDISKLSPEKDIVILVSFDYFISSGFNMFEKELPSPTLDEIAYNINNLIETLSSFEDRIKIICLANNPNYSPDELMKPIGQMLINKIIYKNWAIDAIKGPFYHSQKVSLDLQNLLEITRINLLNDPRYLDNNDHHTIDTYLNKTTSFSINTISLPIHMISYKNCEEALKTTEIKYKRNNYEYYLKLLENLDLTSTKEKLNDFIRTQEDPKQSKDSLKGKFDILKYEIHHITRQTCPYRKISTAEDVKSEYMKLKERDDKIIEKTFKEIDNFMKDIGEKFGFK